MKRQDRVLGLAPEDVQNLSPQQAAELYVEASAVTAALLARMLERTPASAQPATTTGLLTVEAAAKLAGVSREAFLRRKRFRSTIVKIGHRTLRVSEKRLLRVLDGLGA